VHAPDGLDPLANGTIVTGGQWAGLQIAAEVLGSISVVTIAAATFTDLESGGKMPGFTVLNAAITIARVNCILFDSHTDPVIHYMIFAGDGLVRSPPSCIACPR